MSSQCGIIQVRKSSFWPLLKVIGQFQGYFVYKTRTTSQPVYVVDGLKTNLLGLPTITALNLATRIDALTGVSELCC